MSENTNPPDELKSIEVSSLTELRRDVVYFVQLPPNSVLENVEAFQQMFAKHRLKGIFVVGQANLSTLTALFESSTEEQKAALLAALQPKKDENPLPES